MKLPYTRTMVRAALAGELDDATYVRDPVFGFEVPSAVQGVPSELLSPRGTWADPAAYDAQARKLAAMFRENFEQFRAEVPEAVVRAGPAI
jgi:phosphoenolpyruvate carboxykinase (ATP)